MLQARSLKSSTCKAPSCFPPGAQPELLGMAPSGERALEAVELLESALADALRQAAREGRQHAQRAKLARGRQRAPARSQDCVEAVRDGRRLRPHCVQAALHPKLVGWDEVQLPQQLGHPPMIAPARQHRRLLDKKLALDASFS